MFERFTEKAIKVIMLAQEEARRLGHNFVGTEQVLLGLIGEGTGIAAKTLKSMGVNLKDARVEVEKIIGRGSGFVAVEIPFTPRAKRVLELSWDEARQLGHNYIGTEHLLLGLIREGEGVAARVLENLGVDLNKVRSNVVKMLGDSKPTASSGVGGGSSASSSSSSCCVSSCCAQFPASTPQSASGSAVHSFASISKSQSPCVELSKMIALFKISAGVSSGITIQATSVAPISRKARSRIFPPIVTNLPPCGYTFSGIISVISDSRSDLISRL